MWWATACTRAATMGRLRTAVHTLADLDLPPDELLTHLDDLVNRLDRRGRTRRAIDRGGQPGATCLYAVYDPVSRRCTLARAGHPPPALVPPDGTVDFPDLPAGPPLGLGGLPFEAAELTLPEGSLLALYTDGLSRPATRTSTSALERAARARWPRPDRSLEETCDAVLGAAAADRPTDDVALLLARTRALDPDRVATWELPRRPGGRWPRPARDASRQLAEWGLEELAFTTELIVSELVTNAIRYGTRAHPAAPDPRPRR